MDSGHVDSKVMSTMNISLPDALKALRKGLESGGGIPANRAHWAGKRRRITRGS